jgi:hypothetical protein
MFCQRSTSLFIKTSRFTKWTLQIAFAVLFALTCYLPASAVTAPTISPSTGTYSTQQTVTITPPTLPIYVTFDGTQPTTASTLYTAPLTITTATQIKAVAYDAGTSTYSSVTTAYLDVDPKYAPILASPFISLRLRSDFGLITGAGSPPFVTQWIDVSGQTSTSLTNNSVSAPILASISAGRPTVRFTGSSNLALSSTAFNNFTGATYFLVTRPTSLTAGSRFFDFGRGVSGDNILMRINNTGSLGAYETYNGTSPTSVTSAAALTSGRYQLLEASQTSTSPYTATFSLNAVAGTSGSMNLPPNTSRTLNFLGQGSSGGNYLSGDIAEVLMYYTQISASQANAVEAYLLQKYQVLSQVPATPLMSVAGGTLLQPTQLAISTEPDSLTFVTTDGTTPTSASTPYSGGPLQIDYSQTVKAITIKNGVSSSVATATYTLDATQFPAPSPSDVTTPTINVVLPAPSL